MNVDLVVGGAGFIGSHLCDALIQKGDVVICLDNLMRGNRENVSHLLSNANFVFIRGDVNTIDLPSLIAHYSVNYIYHLAANSDIQASAENPSIEFECTASTTWNILSAMKKTGVKRMFFASTSAVYGEGKCAFKEGDALAPVSYYGSAKMASEAFIHAFSYMNDFDILVFRFPNVIGPRLTHGVFFDFIKRLRDNPNELRVLGDGTQCKPYIYVSDLINAIMLLLESNRKLNIYNLGVETATDVKTIAKMVVNEMGLEGKAKIVYGKGNVGWKGDIPHFQYDLEKIHSTGWKPKYTSNEASLKTIRVALGKEQ